MALKAICRVSLILSLIHLLMHTLMTRNTVRRCSLSGDDTDADMSCYPGLEEAVSKFCKFALMLAASCLLCLPRHLQHLRHVALHDI